MWGNGGFRYDPLDNLRGSVVGSRSTALSYDDAGTRRLSMLNVNGSLIGLAYDAQGNVTGRGTQGYYFDQGNRLQLANGIATYAYDGWGRRTTVNASSGVTRTQMYGRSGQLLFGQTRQGMSSWNTRYVYLGSKLIAESIGLSNVYVHTDALGSPVARTNGAGGLISRTRYEPYGATAAGTNPGSDGSTGIGFTGHVNDAESGLVYMQQRYYDPIAGRFLSVDPVTTDTATGRSFGRYHYSENNPYRYKDPDGRESVGELIDRKATENAIAGNGLKTYGWAFAGTAWKALGAEGISQIADKGFGSTSTGDLLGGGLELAAALPGGKVAAAGAKTIVETSGVIKKADALTGKSAAAYEKVKDLLSQGKAGANQHTLTGDLAGKSAADLAGSGKGRGAERVIFSSNENEVIIHDIVDYHKK